MRPQVLNPTTCKTLLFLLPLCFSLPYVARADDSERDSWAVQFRVTDNFTLSSFGGSVLSLNKHISDSNAFRASVGLSIANNKDDATNTLGETRTSEADCRGNQTSLRAGGRAAFLGASVYF
jgi:hypothetical protein